MNCFFKFFRVVSLLFTFFLPVMLGAQDGRLGLNTVVIDPGHGGNDPGCISKDRKTREKDTHPRHIKAPCRENPRGVPGDESSSDS